MTATLPYIYTFKVVYNTRVEYTTHDNYSYIRYLHIYKPFFHNMPRQAKGGDST